jgi:NAD dependent epimerase/dehydratase family enzyme
MADDLLLGSARVMPFRLSESNFQFKYPKLDDALRSLLNR